MRGSTEGGRRRFRLELADRQGCPLEVGVHPMAVLVAHVCAERELREVFGAADHAHTTSTASGRSFQNHRVADLLRPFQPLLFALDHAL